MTQNTEEIKKKKMKGWLREYISKNFKRRNQRELICGNNWKVMDDNFPELKRKIEISYYIQK